MERGEQLDGQRRLADAAVQAAETKLAGERERAAKTVAEDQRLVVEIDAARQAQRAGIGQDSLSLYDRISKAKGTGIAEAWLQKCTACQMLVRPQRWNDLRERDNQERMTCESCGRLLWYDPARDTPQHKVIESESIAARIVRGL